MISTHQEARTQIDTLEHLAGIVKRPRRYFCTVRKIANETGACRGASSNRPPGSHIRRVGQGKLVYRSRSLDLSGAF